MIQPVRFFRGSDPEGFLAMGGKVIGSEKVIPAQGLGHSSKVVRDGVQFELNPQARSSFRELAYEVSECFRLLRETMSKYPGVEVSWDGVVEVSQTELATLSKKSRELGCQPSKNIYGDFPITVSGTAYPMRSAGGHMHFGLFPTSIYDGKGQDERVRLIQALDYLVGNTGVLFDRDARAAERRQNYGRAGEYRYPKYGAEYRTLSNFWLRNYTLASLMWSMAALAVGVVETSITSDTDYAESLFESVDVRKVRQAIDQNDANLAWTNFKDMLWLIKQYVPEEAGFGVHAGNVERVIQFADEVQTKGLSKVFPEDPVWHWITKKFVDFS